MFSSRSGLIFAFTFMSMIFLGLLFVYCMRKELILFIFHLDSQLS